MCDYLILEIGIHACSHSDSLKTYMASLMQAVFVERVEFLSVTTKTKTLEVKGRFYSKEDMKSELGYHPNIG